MTPQVSVVVPVFNEGEAIVEYLDRLLDEVKIPCEVLVVFDSADDTTRPHLEKFAQSDPRVAPTLNTEGNGPGRALRYGISRATSDVVVVTMADGCDDPRQIEELTHLVQRGVVVAAASRYTKGGQQVGGGFLKSTMSRLAGRSLFILARVGTRDATNSFKAYSRDFVREVGIESDEGFELGIELVAKARRRRLPVAEIPTIWLDRAIPKSNFQLWSWLPRYIHWYLYAFGPRIS